jgi:hypothetical protein
MNVEHSLWMAMTLDLETYGRSMVQIGWSMESAEANYRRIASFKQALSQ